MRAQLKGSTAAINATAGYKGVIVLNTDTNRLHVLTGVAGNSIELANLQDIPDPIDISGKADKTYVDQQLANKQPIGDYATSTELTEGLATKLGKSENAASATKATQDASGNVITTTYATKSELSSGLASKQPTGDYATNTALTQGLATKVDSTTYSSDKSTFLTKIDASTTYLTKTDANNTYLNKTAKAESAKVADNILWANVQNIPDNVSNAVSYATQSLTDEQKEQLVKNLGGTFLPLVGGTLTGGISFPNGINFSVGSHSLSGTTSGGFTWDNLDVELVKTRYSASETLRIRYDSGLMILGAAMVIPPNTLGITWTFPYPFNVRPVILASPAGLSDPTYLVSTQGDSSTTEINVFSKKKDGTYTIERYVFVMAIGTWK